MLKAGDELLSLSPYPALYVGRLSTAAEGPGRPSFMYRTNGLATSQGAGTCRSPHITALPSLRYSLHSYEYHLTLRA
ncbi:hypothetical protein J6590_026981 [Homalodisca vitripennis]|nr:hypothetical protein J6590_026981 [Homalodisca vitripennis]